MHQLPKLIGLFVMITALSGCVIAIGNDNDSEEKKWKNRQIKNNAYINSLDIGISIRAVETDLGAADIKESFQRDGETFQILHYRTRHRHSDGRTTRDETTPLVFLDKKLVGWGQIAIEKATK